MLTLESLKEFVKKYQTLEKNVVREYIQYLFLSSLYKRPQSEKLLFKGGTALRFVFQSPRFSEDLDFTGKGIRHSRFIDKLFIETLSEIEKQGIKTDLQEAKTTSGGYLGVVHYELHGFKEDMKFEVSLRKGRKFVEEETTIISDYTPPYNLVHLSGKGIVESKLEALLERRKSRDYYDLYFFLRHPQLHKFVKKDKLQVVLKSLGKERINFKPELSAFLPVSHHRIIKDFKLNLSKEIKKFL